MPVSPDVLELFEIVLQLWDLRIDSDKVLMEKPTIGEDLHAYTSGAHHARVECRNQIGFLYNAIQDGGEQ